MEINVNKYKTNSIYVLNNGYYIDLIVQNNGTTIMVVKSPEGASYSERLLNSNISSNSPNLKSALNSELSSLSTELNESELTILEIIPKKAIPPRKSTNSFKLIGKVVNKEGNPLENTQIQPTLITAPEDFPTLPNAGTEFDSIEQFEANQTDFENTTFEFGSALIVDPVFTNTEGIFVWEYVGDENIDFELSFVVVSKEEYFPKDVGPKLIKTGEEFLSKVPPSINRFEGPTQVINQKLLQLEDGKYQADITLQAAGLGITVNGIGISQDREIAKKKARSDAEKKLATLASPSQEEVEKIKFDVYDLGRIILEPIKVNIEEQVVEAQIEIQEAENKIIKKQSILDAPFEIKLTARYNTEKEKLKRLLIPYVLNLLSKFGPTIIANILGGKKDPLADRICLSQEQLLDILNKRNKLTRQINNLYKVVRVISKILKVTNAFIFGIKLASKIAQGLTAVPGPITPPFFGLKDLWNGLVEQGFYEGNRILEKAGITVSTLNIAAATIGFLLSYVLELLKKLDFLIQDCAEQINPETGGFTLSFEKIDIEVNNFTDPTNEEEQDIIDPLTGRPFPYKGFTFEIKQDTSQNFQYPKRYAIARNVQGIQVLRSESSFASNPSILIEELKFVIDRDNLRAD